ncbi:MAG: Mov34/MPN/PAD-1 family protein [Candidatus Promineofilum sp.]|nr:Mov34/MPN/PAD-1 family protein [Promineifilum sp.]
MTSASNSDKRDKASPPPADATTRGESVRVETPAAHREAMAALPFRQPPAPPGEWLAHGDAPVEGQPIVLMHQTALLQVVAHSRSDTRCELGGALLGHTYRYKNSVIVEVKAAVPATSADHGPVHFTFSADSWSKLHRDRTAHYSNLDIIGWFHTHPDLGVFYSSDDVVVHSAAFTLPWHVGLVVDPIRDEAAFFGWVGGVLSPLGGFYELPERQPDTQTPWRVVRSSVWDQPYELQTPSDADSRVVLARSGRPRFSGRELGLAASAAALMLSFFLIVGGVLPLQRRVSLLETTVLNLAQVSLADSNALTCPDPRLRILTPLNGQAYAAGSTLQIIGTADYPEARRYQIEVRPTGDTEWNLIDRSRRDTSLGLLANWETSEFPAGSYEARLSPVDLNNIRLANSSPCIVNVNLTPVNAGQP